MKRNTGTLRLVGPLPNPQDLTVDPSETSSREVLARLLRTTGSLLAVLLVCMSLGNAAWAQEFRGTISGSVMDSNGAMIPGAEITVTEQSTGTVNHTTSDNAGQYVVPFLLPGTYNITVTKDGFSNLQHAGIQLHAQEHPIINLTMNVGSQVQTVTVTAEEPLINQANASVGQVITTESVADLPLNGRTPTTLSELSAGVITTAAPQQVHPFDNNAGNSWSMGGTPNQVSEVLLDGSPDLTLLGALAYAPTQDSVSEVSVHPFDTDASFGHTIGGVINQVTKSGTNQLHGSAYEFGQISGIDANTYFNARNNGPLPVFHFNQYGLTTGGPVRIPKVYNGKDKLFFFFAWEGLKDSTPATTTLTVPTQTSIGGSPGTGGEANGDFYQTLVAGCPNGFSSNTPTGGAVCNADSKNPKPYADPNQLYDPWSGTLNSKSQVVRTPIYNNQLTSLPGAHYPNPVGLAYLKLFPAPNTSVGVAPNGLGNYTSNAPSVDTYNNEFGRLDYNLNTRDHVFFDMRHNNRAQSKNNYFGNNTTGTTLTRENFGATLDNVFTLNQSTIFDVRFNWTLFKEAHGTQAQAYSPSSVGLPSNLASGSNEVQLPYVNFNGAGSCSTNSFMCLGDTGSAIDPTTSYQLFADMVKILGNHSLKIGFDGRQYRLSVQNFGASSGTFTFNTSVMNAGGGGVSSAFGLDLASLLVGLPSSGSYDNNARGDYHQYYIGTFIQDDWRVNNRLTLNLGMRFDIDTPFEERLGRTVNGWNPTAAVNYAANPTFSGATVSDPNGVKYTAASINTAGGLTFPNQSNGAEYATNSGFFSPRAGFSFSADSKTVFRGGFGIFVQPEGMSSMASTGVTSSNALSNQEGFSASTSFVESTNGVTPTGSLSNPFPAFATPAGSSLGASTFLGSPSAINFLAPVQHDPYSERWNLGFQRTITANTLLEVLYVGNHGVHLPVGAHNINATQKQYLTTNPYSDQAISTAYSTKVTNPFYGTLGAGNTTGTNTSKTVSFSSLLVPYPQYGSAAITEQNQTIGESNFNSGIIHIEQRAKHGLTLTANYSFSKMIEADTYLNDQDTALTRRISPFDHAQHFTVGGTYQLPFGRGKMFDFGGSRLWDEIAGGFVLNSIYQFQTGAPIFFSQDLILQPGVNLRQIANKTRNTAAVGSGTPALNTSLFVTGNATCTTCDGSSLNNNGNYNFHYRTLPQTLSWVRQDGYNNLDASLLKNFKIREGSYFQLRFETFNTLNHAVFAAPNISSATASNFGYITSTISNSQPRQVQIGGRLVF